MSSFTMRLLSHRGVSWRPASPVCICTCKNSRRSSWWARMRVMRLTSCPLALVILGWIAFQL